MFHNIASKITYGYKSLSEFIVEENLKGEAVLSLFVFFVILFILVST